MFRGFVRPARRCAIAVTAVTLSMACRSAESSADPGGEPVVDGVESSAGTEAPGFATEQPRVEATILAPGTRMTLQLLGSLSTETNRVGDRFQAALVQNVTSSTGELLLRAGTHATGVVEIARKSPSADEPAVLQLRLESIEIDGTPTPLQASIVDAQAAANTRDSRGETTAKIAVGTAAGAVVGGILGQDRKGALIGAGAGAVAGTVFAVTTDDGHAWIDQGSTVTIVLDEPLQVR